MTNDTSAPIASPPATRSSANTGKPVRLTTLETEQVAAAGGARGGIIDKDPKPTR